MSKILIIGINGQLAFDLKKVLGKNYQVFGADHQQLDITDLTSTDVFIKKINPNIIINTAAYHNTKLCEVNPEISFQVNALGALNVAKVAKNIQAKVIFLSTDYIFDGRKKGYFEQDLTNPLNIYGASKLAGENLVKIANNDYYIIRTSWLFGKQKSGKGHNFVSLMLEKAQKNKKLEIVDDQYGCPTYTLDLSLKIKEMLDVGAPSGTYHIVNQGICSWCEFAKEIFNFLRIPVKTIPISSDKIQSDIKRPKYSVLKSKNLQKAGIKKPRSWKEALHDYIKNEL